MNLHQHPDLLDRLAASYALGTLRGGARRRFETMSRESAVVRSAALLWSERMNALTELQVAEAPSPNVWKRIAIALEQQAAAGRATATNLAPAADSSNAALALIGRHLRWWRGAALVGGVSTAAVALLSVALQRQTDQAESRLAQAAHNAALTAQTARQNELRLAQLQSELRAAPQIDYVAVLADDRATASMLVTYDPRNNSLTVKRVGSYHAALDKSLQLWALPGPATPGQPAGGPKSLGVLSDGDVIQLSTPEGQVKQAAALAISLEPKGGVPSEGGPTGPVLFKGALIATRT